jgi:hypothetical protein
MESTGRIFKCARCFKQVIICSRCDRGQRYCSPDCSETARNHSQRAASHRYQQSREGRIKHALRMRLYRLRKQIVTHQGSQPWVPNGLLQTNPADTRKADAAPFQSVVTRRIQCHFCGCHCSEFVRLDFLQRRRVRYLNPLDQRGSRNDYSP